MEFEGVNKLARVMQERMQKVGERPLVLDFGSIQADFSLVTNTFPIPIPKSDYMVCRRVGLGVERAILGVTAPAGGHTHTGGEHTHSGGAHAQETGSGTHSHDGGEHTHTVADHIHDVLISGDMASIKPGDRVLVAWIGNDAVVVDVVIPASGVK